jgi:hypothetical protein
MSITLLQLRTQARQRADMEESTFVTDAELNSYINGSIAELHDMMVQSYGEDYFVKTSTFNTTAGTDNYSLASIITDNDFYKVRGVDAKVGGNDFYTLKKFNFNERNKFKHDGIWNYLGITAVKYRLVGTKLYFTPAPDSAVEVKIWYIPKAAVLVLDVDILDDLNQFAEYVIVDAAIKMLNKEESDVQVLMAQKAGLKQRIEEVANNRDAGESESVQDVYSENNDFYYGRSN